MGGSSRGKGLYVYIKLIHFIVQQKLAQHFKAIILQFKKKKRSFGKMNDTFSRVGDFRMSASVNTALGWRPNQSTALTVFPTQRLTPQTLVCPQLRSPSAEPNPGECLSDRGRKGGVMVSWESLPRDELPSHQAHRALPHSCSCFSLGNLSFEWLIMSFLGLEPRCRPGVGAGAGALRSASAEGTLLNRPSEHSLR